MINRIPKALLAAALVCTVSLPCVAESLSLADLENAQDAQMVEMDSQNTWNYPIPYELLTTSEYIVLANKENLLDENYVPEDLVKLTCRKSVPIRFDARSCRTALSVSFDRGQSRRRYVVCPFRLPQLSHAKHHVFQPFEKEQRQRRRRSGVSGFVRSSNGAWYRRN